MTQSGDSMTFFFENLMPCTTYWYEISTDQKICGSDSNSREITSPLYKDTFKTDCYCGSQKCPCGSQHCSNKEESCTKIDGNVACECSDVNAGPNEFGVDCGGLCNRPCRGTPPDWKMIEPIRVVGDTASSIDVVFIPDATYEGHLNQFRTDVIKLIRNGFFHLDLDITKPLPDNYRDQFNFYIYVGGFGPIPFRDYAPSADIAVNLYNAGAGGGMAGCGGPELTAPGRYIPVLLHELGHALWGLAGEREDVDHVIILMIIVIVTVTLAALHIIRGLLKKIVSTMHCSMDGLRALVPGSANQATGVMITPTIALWVYQF
jgi:hypothetical protein